MKPQDLACFAEVKDVLGEPGAIEELQKVIDCLGDKRVDKTECLLGSFHWGSTNQGRDFWESIRKKRAPQGYTPPSNPSAPSIPAGITQGQMDEIKDYIVKTVKENMNINVTVNPTVRGVQADTVIIDDPAANDDVFDDFDVQEHPVEAWEPKGGDWTIYGDGDVDNSGPNPEWARFGTERNTQEQAEKTRDAMRVFNRLLAYRDEFDPEFDWDNGYGYYVYYDDSCYTYGEDEFGLRTVAGVYMSKEVAESLCEKLNSGEVTL